MSLRNMARCAAASLLAAFAGCGESAVGPTPPATTVGVTSGPGPALSAYRELSVGAIVRRTVALDTDIVATTLVTVKDGGLIWIEQAGLFVYFPKHAVSTDLQVTVTANAGNRLIYSFEPHGTVFELPIYIGQLVRYTELNTPRGKKRPVPWGGYLEYGLADVTSDGNGNFKEVFNATYDGSGNDTYAYFSTTHFSGYALASGVRSTIQEPSY
jgi:hypothetical protein